MGFEKVYITKKGSLLAAKTLQGKQIVFDHAEVGSGTLSGDARDKTSLTKKVLECPIGNIKITGETQATISFAFNNENIASAFYFREIGLFAIDPDTEEKVLYAYSNAGETAEYINNSMTELIEKNINIVTLVDNASNINITLDPNQIYVTEKEAKEMYDNAVQEAVDIIKHKKGKVYGVKRSITTSSSAWTRIEDAEGLVANATKDGTAVVNDFDSLYPWSDIISYNYDVEAKRITSYYGEPTFKFDGSNGEVMTRFPEFWYKREQKDGYEYVYIADYAAEGFIKSEAFSLSRYTASGSATRLYSKSDATPLNNVTPGNFRTYAKALGIGWGLMDIWHYSLLQLLYLVEYADYNSQSKLGKGVVNKEWTGSFNGENSGGCDSLGMKSGCLADDGLHSVIYRGIEDILGNMWQILDGVNINNCQAYVCYDSEDYAFDVFDGSYQKLGYVNSKTSEQYTKKLGYDSNNPLIQMPIEGGGSSNTYVSDYYWCTAEEDAKRVAWVGGGWHSGLDCGLWYWACSSASSNTAVDRACRLLLNQ